MVGSPPAGGQVSTEKQGRLAEWLGIGLQNRVRRFESATDLNKILFLSIAKEGDFLFSARSSLAKLRDENKKDQGALKALRDFVAKVSTTADHEIIRHCLRS